MNKRKQAKAVPAQRLSKRRLIMFGAIAAIVCAVGAISYVSLTPINGSYPVLQAPINYTIKAAQSQTDGWHWLSVASSKVKGSRLGGSGNVMNPEYTFVKGELESFHVINEDYTTHSQHNFNIDEFNVHTKNLNYFESQSFTILADKTGTFEYYCTLHPEMRGKVVVQ